jgi:hypothetical protein
VPRSGFPDAFTTPGTPGATLKKVDLLDQDADESLYPPCVTGGTSNFVKFFLAEGADACSDAAFYAA